MDPGLQALGERVQSALADALTALIRRDLSLADHVVRADLAVNQLRYRLEEKASEALTATSDAIEVRRLVATLYVLADLERIGDHAEGIAKVALMLGDSPVIRDAFGHWPHESPGAGHGAADLNDTCAKGRAGCATPLRRRR